MWVGKIQTPKTKNAYRQVDLSPALADLLREYVAGRRPGLLFSNSAGNALPQANLLHRLLYPILDELEQAHAGFMPSGASALRTFASSACRRT